MSTFLKLVDVIMSKYGYVRGLRRKALFFVKNWVRINKRYLNV